MDLISVISHDSEKSKNAGDTTNALENSRNGRYSQLYVFSFFLDYFLNFFTMGLLQEPLMKTKQLMDNISREEYHTSLQKRFALCCKYFSCTIYLFPCLNVLHKLFAHSMLLVENPEFWVFQDYQNIKLIFSVDPCPMR